jgi:hypothetical protein
MKKTLFIALIALATGCQQSAIVEPGLPGNNSGLLEKVEVISLPQNIAYLSYRYDYNDAGLVARITTNYANSSGGNTVNTTNLSTFTRDAQGRVTSIFFTPDTAAYKAVLAYQGNTRMLNYVNMIKKSPAGDLVIDSLVYTYNSQERVSRTDQFILQTNKQLKKMGYQEYSWDPSGNLLSKQTYQDNDLNGQFEASIKYSWEYDSKPNPRQYNDPAIAYWSYMWPTGMSANNVIKQMNKYPANGGPDDQLNYTFQYSTDNKPVTETKDQSSTITRYTYYK